MSIKLLADSVINKIAAGEVVDRPVAVVRELVDNAVDAGASQITVILEESGKKSIQVIDNGFGMSRADAELCVLRHATSKITSDQDLVNISTLGFRGEALASIAAVSKLILKTKTNSEKLGVKIILSAGIATAAQECTLNQGTEIIVNDLFFNTPARKKFLKSDAAEERAILKWLRAFSLAHPQIRFKLLSNNKELLVLNAESCNLDRYAKIVSKPYFQIAKKIGEFSLTALLGHPGTVAANSDLTILVNNRVVNDRGIFRAIKDAFGSMLKHYEQPRGVLAISMPGWLVDVNVHPQKSEVRFRSSGEIFKLVYEAVKESLQELKANVLIQDVSAETKFASNQETQLQSEQVTLNFRNQNDILNAQDSKFLKSIADHQQQAELDRIPALTSSATQINNFSFKSLRFIGQVLDCFLICESKESGLVIIDLHAAHERINFNLVRKRYQQKEMPQQLLLLPETIALNEDQYNFFIEQQELFSELGFDLENFGLNQVLIRAVPLPVANINCAKLILELLSNSAQTELRASFERTIDYVAARIACHASLRSGDYLKLAEVETLLAQLDAEDCGAACPHGRPILVNFTLPQIESWFGRDK